MPAPRELFPQVSRSVPARFAPPAVPDVPVIQPEASESDADDDSDNDEPPRETPRPLKLY